MCAFGNLWDSKHRVLVDPDPEGTGLTNVDLVVALRDHFLMFHRDWFAASAQRTLDLNQKELERLNMENELTKEWLKAKIRQHALWNTEFLKQLNLEGTLI